MSLTEVVLGIRRTKITVALGPAGEALEPPFEFEIDCTLSENHEHAAEVTRYPVEDGSNISDHVDVQPFQLRLSGIQSDTPLAAFVPFELVTALQGSTLSKDAYDFFRDLMVLALRVDLETTLERYESMVLTRLSVPRAAANRNGLVFDASFQQLEVAQSETVAVSDALIAEGDKPLAAKGDAGGGAEAKTKAAKALPPVGESWLRNLLRVTTGLFGG